MTKIVKAEDGIQFRSLNDTMRVKVDGSDTVGRYTLIEEAVEPGFDLPLQLHRHHSKTFYILEGEIAFTVGKETVEGKPGMTVHLPANTPHAAHADRAAKMLTLFSPAGFEVALKAFGAITSEHFRDPTMTRTLMDEFDIVGLSHPPVPALLGFYDALLTGDADSLNGLFIDEPQINTPLQGRVKGSEAFGQFVDDQQSWLADRKARAEFVNVVVSPARVVVEFVLYLTQDGETLDLPVALAADREDDRVSAIRIYYSTWPLTGGHTVRPPMLTPPTDLDEPAVVRAYTASLYEGNAELVLSLFAEDGYAREPSGARFKYEGPEALREFYSAILSTGGISVHHCTVTFDGGACAVEYIADAWANVELPPQSGLAVYELTGPARIKAARIYDDVAPPLE